MDKFMKEALSEAKKSLSEGGIPIGSVLIKKWYNHWSGTQ